jgi:hypothetical protein
LLALPIAGVSFAEIRRAREEGAVQEPSMRSPA